MSDGEPKTQVPESERLKAQIDAEIQKANEAQNTKPVTEPVVSAQSPAEAPSQPADKQAASAPTSEKADVNVEKAPAKPADKQSDDVREWAKRKGIKDEESALRSLRNLERELHRRSFEDRQKGGAEDVQRPVAPYYQPTPQMPPAWQPTPAVPAYQPPSNPGFIDRKALVAQEAERYGMTPEDFERVLAVSNDIADVRLRRLKAEFDSEIKEMRRETRRNSEFADLMQDPFFANPEVQFEMHKVLEENPKALTFEPAPYTYAFNEAQRRLARRYLQGDKVPKPTEEKDSNRLPTTPPSEGARGSSFGGAELSAEESIVAKFNQAKDAEEQKKILSSLGAVRSNY